MKDFIPYEQALTLKEFGLDEPCFGKWLSFKQSDWKVYELILEMGMNEEFEDNRNFYLREEACSAPTFSQAFRFFREKYGYDYSIKPVYGEKHYRYYRVNIYVNEKLIQVMKYYFPDNPYFDNREEAELEALKKLIEIVKNK